MRTTEHIGRPMRYTGLRDDDENADDPNARDPGWLQRLRAAPERRQRRPAARRARPGCELARCTCPAPPLHPSQKTPPPPALATPVTTSADGSRKVAKLAGNAGIAILDAKTGRSIASIKVGTATDF